MKPGKDIGKQEYLFKLKSRPSFSSVEALTYKRYWTILCESLVKSGGYFPELTSLFTLVFRVSSFSKCLLFRGKGPVKRRTICGKHLRIPTCDPGSSIPFVTRAHSTTSFISEDVRSGAWEVDFVWSLLGGRAGERCARGTSPGFASCLSEFSKMELPLVVIERAQWCQKEKPTNSVNRIEGSSQFCRPQNSCCQCHKSD